MEKLGEVLDKMVNMMDKVDVVMVGGPATSLVWYGKTGTGGFVGERVVNVTRRTGGKEACDVTNRMNNLVKTSIVVKGLLIDKRGGLSGRIERWRLQRV